MPFPLPLPQAVLCGVSAPPSICHCRPVPHTPQIFGGSNRVIPNLPCAGWPRGDGAWPPAVDQPLCTGRGRLHSCFPLCHWEHPVLMGLFPKPGSQIRHKWFIKPLGEPFEEPAEHLQAPANKSSPRSFFCPTGSTVYTQNKTASSHVGWPAGSPVPQLSSSLRERGVQPSPTQTSANQPGSPVA